jgi:hypothetical protein
VMMMIILGFMQGDAEEAELMLMMLQKTKL